MTTELVKAPEASPPATEGLVESQDLKAYEIPLAEIYCDNDFNCRGAIVPADVVELARSIADNGLQQAIVIQPYDRINGKKYRIVSGHRRYHAFRINSSNVIPAVIKTGLSELKARQLNLEENLKRKSLNLLQEARALQPFTDAGWTEIQIANEFNQSRGWVQARLALLKLPEEIQNEAAAGFLTQEHVKQLKGMKSRDEQFEAVKKIKNAKILGEKRTIRATPKKTNPFKKQHRDRQEIFQMMEMFMDVCGAGFHTRCLAWAAGEISTFELLRDFKDYALKEHGKHWRLPDEMANAFVTGKR